MKEAILVFALGLLCAGCGHDPSDGDDSYYAAFDTYSKFDTWGHFSR